MTPSHLSRESCRRYTAGFGEIYKLASRDWKLDLHLANNMLGIRSSLLSTIPLGLLSAETSNSWF
jgi:hypothetical protein